MQSSLPTYQDSLSDFIGKLRYRLFASQEEVATYFCLDRSRISRYENGHSIPKLGYLAGLARLLAEQVENGPKLQQHLLQEVNQAVNWHYGRGRFQDWQELCSEADEYLITQQNKKKDSPSSPASSEPSTDDWQIKLTQRLDLPPDRVLIGVEDHLNHLQKKLIESGPPWLLSIDGMGGIGKTALANHLIRQPELPRRFQDVAWVSAKQQQFLPGIGLQEISGPALQAESLIDSLLEQLDGTLALAQPPPQKKAALVKLLKENPYLIVVDNLETVEDHQALLPLLLKLANPSKFLLTSRYRLHTYPDIFSLGLKELDQANTLRFIRHEIESRGLSNLIGASESHFKAIYQVVGGNPLALKLVVGQMSVLSLSQILEKLKQSQAEGVNQLYTYIYWQAWQMLDSIAQTTFLMMPMAHGGKIDQLLSLTGFEADQLEEAIQQLVRLSLIQVEGNLEQRRYTLHRLTETFILNEAIIWKTST